MNVTEGWSSTSRCWEAVVKPMKNRGKWTMKWQIIHDSWKTKNKILKLLVLYCIFSIEFLIICCSGPLGSLLSWGGWIPISRLTFGAYLTHGVYLFIFYFSQSSAFFLSDMAIVSTDPVCYLKLYRWRTFAEMRKFYHVLEVIQIHCLQNFQTFSTWP